MLSAKTLKFERLSLIHEHHALQKYTFCEIWSLALRTESKKSNLYTIMQPYIFVILIAFK